MHFLILLLFSSFLIQEVVSQCKCPEIKNIDKAAISKLSGSKYLGTRTTMSATFSVNKDCLITVDFTKVKKDIVDFEFMIFRTSAPPIFNIRFTSKTTKTKRSPEGISCAQVNGVYEWQYYGAKVTDMAFALQIPECDCSPPHYGGKAPNPIIPNFAGACDAFTMTCHKGQFPQMNLALFMALGVPQNNNMVYSDLRCVNKKWYYNNYYVGDYFNSWGPVVNCPSTETVFSFPEPGRIFKHRYICGCREMEFILDHPYAYLQLDRFVSGPSYANEKFRNATIIYNDATCSARMTCTGNDTMVILSGTYAPRKYVTGDTPTISCHASGARPNPDSTVLTKKQWFVDGIMMNMPTITCLRGVGCDCKYVLLTAANIQKFVGSYPFYKYIANRTRRPPTDNRKGLTCPTEISCIANYTLVVFDLVNTSVFPSGKMKVVCTASTRKWSIEKAVDVPVTEVIYAVCVDLR